MHTTIELGSEAFRELASVIAHPTTYKVSIELRAEGVAIKMNEGTWSPTLAVTK